MTIISFRGYQTGKQKPFHAYLLLFDRKDKTTKTINLSEYYASLGIDNVADPKLTILDEKVWVTFNTGYSINQNKLYIAPVYPHQEPPYECRYRYRQRIEKNWSFFFEDKAFRVIYSLFPLTILTEAKKDDANRIIFFTKKYESNYGEISGCYKKISIGTQAVKRDNRFYLIAHEKKFILGRRIYIGVPIRIIKKNNQYSCINSNLRIIHSYLSLLGTIKKHNKNLWSCTYFSGLQIKDDNNVIMAYGINDRGYAFREMRLNNLWGL